MKYALLAVLLLCPMPALAQDSTHELIEAVRALQARIAVLEQQLTPPAPGPHFGHMPGFNGRDFRHVAKDQPGSNPLSGVFGQVLTRPIPNGGPQGVEGYVYMNHPSGSIRLAIGTIGNMEHAGAGDVVEIRGMQSGGIVSGSGRVGRWTGLKLGVPVHPNIQERVDIEFSNGWSLRTNGDSLELWDRRGLRHIF